MHMLKHLFHCVCVKLILLHYALFIRYLLLEVLRHLLTHFIHKAAPPFRHAAHNTQHKDSLACYYLSRLYCGVGNTAIYKVMLPYYLIF